MSTGRPKSSSRETLAEAACELFLEQGYAKTSVADITSRAGVSRSSFFNYFGAKADILWSGLDERIDAFVVALRADAGRDAAATVGAQVRALGDSFAPDALALAIVNAPVMGIVEELEREASVRRSRIAAAVARRLREAETPPLAAGVAGAAYGGAVLSAIDAWARGGASRAPLALTLTDALTIAERTLQHPLG